MDEIKMDEIKMVEIVDDFDNRITLVNSGISIRGCGYGILNIAVSSKESLAGTRVDERFARDAKFNVGVVTSQSRLSWFFKTRASADKVYADLVELAKEV